MLLAKEAARTTGLLGDTEKSDALRAIADAIEQATPQIVAANAEDLDRGRTGGMAEGLAGPTAARRRAGRRAG